MKCKFAVTAILLSLGLGTSMWAQTADGAALYKKKCASCHGATGEGKGKTPALKGTSSDTDAIVQRITKGAPDSKGPHKKPTTGVDEAQAKAIAEFIKSLK
jgi:mono/diheme cytochrome c family protein